MSQKDQINYRENLPHVLLISGSGRNCGKTSLACSIITDLSKSKNVVALKISPHFHKLSEKQVLLFSHDDFKIYKETDSASSKDSSRMLAAGASESIYLLCEDKNLYKAWARLNKVLSQHQAVVCESGSLARLFKPAIHLLVEGEYPDKMKRSYLENKAFSNSIVHFDGLEFDLNIADIDFTGKQWTLKEKQNDRIRRSA